ncbi:hypothetical protein, partial [Stenotrophomonas sepilia]|uniref:hypothetical protein n=1 Tax=Stenotrophomonas sepilia TaxID=2860290 RepID=UPI003EE5EDF1
CRRRRGLPAYWLLAHAGTVGTRFGLVASSNSFFRNFLISTPVVERQDARWLSVDDAPFL